jgi:hypothetical protein
MHATMSLAMSHRFPIPTDGRRAHARDIIIINGF